MSYASDREQVVQLMITTWTFQIGELFQFNSLDYLQNSQFRTVIFQLPFPKNKPVYYFFHCIIEKPKDQRYNYVIERRRELKSDISEKDKNIALKLKLMGGVKLSLKSVNNRTRVCAEPIAAPKIERVKCHGKFEECEYSLPFLVVRTFEKGYELRLNQTIKLGKVQFDVVELNTSNFRQVQLKPQDGGEILNLDEAKYSSMMERTQTGASYSQTDARQCKICYGDDETEDNVLITPCDCKGTGKYIHMNCLKEWIEQKLKKMKNEGQGALYQTSLLFCEICKRPFPKAVVKNGKSYGLLKFLEQSTPYIALSPKGNTTGAFQNLFYVAFQAGDSVKVGRQGDNGFILEDSSVSRKHSEFILDGKDKIFIKDTDSKYGTSIHEDNMEFVIGKKIRAVQQGNTVFSYKIVEPSFK